VEEESRVEIEVKEESIVKKMKNEEKA